MPTPLGWIGRGENDGDDVSRETDAIPVDGGTTEAPDSGDDVSRETEYVPTFSTASTIAAGIEGDDDFADTPIARETQAILQGRAAVRAGNWPRPKAPRVFVVANQKGGVGKTTSTVNLAASLALNNLRVLVVDLDPQGNASTALGVEHRSGTTSVYDALVGNTPMLDMVKPASDIQRLFCIPATIDLAGAEIELVPMVARESRLKRALEPVLEKAEVDYIFIDCPPSLGLLTVNALVASSEVLIPIQCEYYALEGLGQLLHNIDMVKSHLNPELDVSTILLTMYDGRTRLSSQVADEVRSHFGDRVLSTVVPRSVRISEAPSYAQTVMTYDPGSTGALSYLEAAREMAQRADSLPTTPGPDQ
ncbi:MAG: AAA family ATPase [Streptosporangiales bacterium]|nr:AAA family ATPase [Streptosporangiales bacterium]